LPTIEYAPTPPRDRIGLVREADGFEMTIPPVVSWRFVVCAILLGGPGMVMIAAAVWPQWVPRVGPRLSAGAMGAFLMYLVVAEFKQSRGWAVLTLRQDALTVTIPRRFGREQVGRHSLGEYEDAVVQTDLNGGLALVRADGQEAVVLDGLVYRGIDLQRAAAVLRDAIRRRDPEYVREQVRLDEALEQLKQGAGDASPVAHEGAKQD
jgi:hypothetical protein